MSSKYIANNYKILSHISTKPIKIMKALGSRLYDTTGNSYIDATSSYCAANFGHQHPYFKKVLTDQINKIAVCARYLNTTSLNKLGSTVNRFLQNKINVKSGSHIQFLPSSNGVDTIETAIKLARAWGSEIKKIPQGTTIQLFFDGNFHGRTISALSVSNYSYQQKFYPKVPGLFNIKFNNIEQLKYYLSISHSTVSAIFIELVQGEGGIHVAQLEFVRTIRNLCDKYNILMVCDEIQTGLFRTGTLLCSEQYYIRPDIVLLGKSLGGGYLPISMCITSNEIMETIKPGEHGSTFGGNPLAATMATSVLKFVNNEEFKNNIHNKYLSDIKYKYPFIKEIRGRGLLFGIELDQPISSSEVVNQLIKHNIITKETTNNTIRLAPPFVITSKETDELFSGLDNCFSNL